MVRLFVDVGVCVVMVCCLIDRVRVVFEYVLNGGVNDVVVMVFDLSDVVSVRVFVEKFGKEYEKLDVLVNNAGLNGVSGYSGLKMMK